jgi:hypothetical protein
MLMYFMAFWNIFWTFGKFYDHLVHFLLILVHFSGFGITYQEKSGNPVQHWRHGVVVSPWFSAWVQGVV